MTERDTLMVIMSLIETTGGPPTDTRSLMFQVHRLAREAIEAGDAPVVLALPARRPYRPAPQDKPSAALLTEARARAVGW